MKLVFATANQNKVFEVQKLVPTKIHLLSLNDIGCSVDIPETADTFQGNALQKAEYIANKFKLDCFADDSGLEVKALNGAPGVYSARYAGEPKNDHNNIKKLLLEMQNNKERSASFKTVIALILNGKNYFFEGVINGQITNEIKGENGFGYDPVFMPDGYNQTFAEMSPEQKNQISHRALAINKMVGFLNTL